MSAGGLTPVDKVGTLLDAAAQLGLERLEVLRLQLREATQRQIVLHSGPQLVIN